MDPFQVNLAISQLSGLFPNKSQDYLQKQYRRCKYDLNATIQKIEAKNNKPKLECFLSGYFNSVINYVAQFCGCSNSPTNNINADDEAVTVEINLEEETKNLVREDEAFARHLQEEEGKHTAIKRKSSAEKKRLSVDTKDVPRVHEYETEYQKQSRQQINESIFKEDKVEKFASCSSVVKEGSSKEQKITLPGKHEENLGGTSTVKTEKKKKNVTLVTKKEQVRTDIANVISGYNTRYRANSRSPIFEDLPQVHGFDEHDRASSEQRSAAFYRKEAQRHVKIRNQFYNQAHQCLRQNNHQRAQYFFQQAKKETKRIEKNNELAATAFVEENTGGRKYTIDLHSLYVNEALDALDDFLDDEILDLEDENIHSRSLNVITGWGKHSVNGIPKIKPAVKTRLRERRLKYNEINPGLLKVHIYKNSFLTDEL